MAFSLNTAMKITGLHIEPTNICTLKCSGCARTRFIQKWPQHWRNHSIDVSRLMQFLDIDLQNINIEFCGNYGDPIYHPNFVEMVSAFKQRGANIAITTNGSYRTPSWWNELCNHLGPNDVVRFSIDGMPNNFTQYRVNADWESIKLGIDTCVDRGIKTIWKFIPFSFNELQIEQARLLSQDLGMSEFVVNLSDRFDQQTVHLIPNSSLVGKKKTVHEHQQQGQQYTVEPKCLQRRGEHFITATGHYAPCCFVADHRFYYKTQFGKNIDSYNIANTTFTKLLGEESVKSFYQTITDQPPNVCQFNCPGTTPVDQ